MRNVTVLLSTYNGAQYLQEQLDSILKQEGVVVHLLIRDDGSTDGTTNILKNYQTQANVTVLYGPNLGWKDSFMTLLKSASLAAHEFYAFSDQDDVWLPNKLSQAVAQIDKDQPLLYHSNVTLMNGAGEQIGQRYAPDFVPNAKMPSAFLDGFGVGATMVFNAQLMAILKKHLPIKKINHDAYVMAVANLLGKAIYDPNSYIHYRRHSGATTGFGDSEHIKKPTLIDRYRRYKKGPKHNFSMRAEELLVGFGDELAPQDRIFLDKVAHYQGNLSKKLYLLFSPKIIATGIRRTLQVKYRVLVNTL